MFSYLLGKWADNFLLGRWMPIRVGYHIIGRLAPLAFSLATPLSPHSFSHSFHLTPFTKPDVYEDIGAAHKIQDGRPMVINCSYLPT